ncbi:GDP-L-fucose synthase [Lobulomyces angularis]|nr:GDP-L-fucose synthase [Lobulomyces angularis]
MLNEENVVILVTGGSGLIGKALQRVITSEDTEKKFSKRSGENWIFLSSADGDLRDQDQASSIFKKHKPSYVIHLAALVGGLYKNMKFKADFYRDNMLMNENILHLSKVYNVKKVISCLSTCIFPDKTTYPIDEKMIHDGPPHESNYGYAYAKRMVDIINKVYNEQYGCQFTSIIPTNIYGLHDNFSLEDSHVIPGLIHKCYLAQKNNTPFTISGSGSPLRQFIYSKDLAELLVWTLREYKEIEPIILSVGEEDEITIKNVAEEIVKAMKYTGKVDWDTSKADGQHKKTASNLKLRSYLPDYKFTNFSTGIKETVEWFLANFDKVRK